MYLSCFIVGAVLTKLEKNPSFMPSSAYEFGLNGKLNF